MQDGKKQNKTKQNKTEYQVTLKLIKNQEKLLSGANKISEVVAKGFAEGWGSSFPQGNANDFPLGGASSS